MPNIYIAIATDLANQSAEILAAFTNAEQELTTQGAPQTVFLEIYFTGGTGTIRRIWDDTDVSSLSASEQLRLYPQLGGLFNLTMKQLLYP